MFAGQPVGELLRVPPFPGATAEPFARPAASSSPDLSDDRLDEIIAALRTLRVGGSYWGAQPRLPERAYTLVRVRDAGALANLPETLVDERTVLCWVDRPTSSKLITHPKVEVVSGLCDPWHLLSRASAVVADVDDELVVLGAIAGVPLRSSGAGELAAATAIEPGNPAPRQLVRDAIGAMDYFNPYTGEPIEPLEAISLCGFWRNLIDSNRDLAGAVGFGLWKRPTVTPLLWAGSGPVPFRSRVEPIGLGAKVAVWKARTPKATLAELERRGAQLVEVEDGFIRSAGLGADCVPPLSIIVDRMGVHFDPNRPSELEEMLENGNFSNEMVDRARHLRELIVVSGLSKYEVGRTRGRRRASERRHILVPGQVEDDRAVVSGGQGLNSNLELLRRVRSEAPDAYILYKPHPDVEAGHRAGAIPDEQCLTLADEVVRRESISALLDSVDEVHVNTSLAGFEALLREKPVTTHGVPFYAGWGLTRDLGPVPRRRTARRTLDELVAAVLLLYPRYVDPVTGLPCPPEMLVCRLSGIGAPPADGVIVRLRRLQGRFKRRLEAFRALVVK